MPGVLVLALLAGCERTATNNRPQVAVSRFTIPSAVVIPWWTPVQTDLLHNSMISALVHTGALTVVERTRLDALLDEQSLTNHGITDPASAASLGKMLGARFFVLGSITNLKFDETHEPVPYTNRTETVVNGRIRVEFRVVDVETSVVVQSDTEDATDQVREITNSNDGRERLRERLVAHCVNNIAGRIVDVLSPIRVAAVAGPSVELNRGAESDLKEGQVLLVFQASADDPTPAPHGSPIAKVQVVKISPGVSTARIVEGGPVQAGALCRFQPEAPSNESSPRPDPLDGQW